MARFSTQNHRIGCIKMPCDRIRQTPVKVVKVANLQGASNRPLEELGEVRYLDDEPRVVKLKPVPEQLKSEEIREFLSQEASQRLEKWRIESKTVPADAIDPHLLILPIGNPRSCEICGKDLPPSDRKNARRTCSDKCRKELAKQESRVENICVICDRSFIYHRKKACCSVECEQKSSQRIGQFAANPDAVRHRDQVCQRPGCGSFFRSVKPQMYCSTRCAQAVLAPNRVTVDVERLKELHGQGLLTHHIAKALGRQHSNISRWLKKLGLEPNVKDRNDPHPFGRRFPELSGDIFYNPSGVGFVAIRPFEPKFDLATDPNWDGTGERFVDQKDGNKLCKDLYPCWVCRFLDYPRETRVICRWAPYNTDKQAEKISHP